jgi:hypothetical protein
MPHHRRTPGEKAHKKQIAWVRSVYTIEPFVKTVDDILDEVLRDERPGNRSEWPTASPRKAVTEPSGVSRSGRGTRPRGGSAPASPAHGGG